jgi:IS30 family transposase
MGIQYSHLSDSKRLVMESMLNQKHSYRAVGRAIGVNASTVCREVQRSTAPGRTYMV